MKREFRLDRSSTGGAPDAAVSVDFRGESGRVEIGGRSVGIELVPHPDGSFVALFEDGRVVHGRVAPGKKDVRVRVRGAETALALFDRRDRVAASADLEGPAEVAAAMPGRVVEVRVTKGDRVAAGDLLLILEAMKMQNEIRAESEQVVAEVLCAAGQAVEAGAALIRFEPVRV